MFGIDMGPSTDEKNQYGALNSASQFATGTGEKDITASSDFMSSILSGDSSKISQALAPQIGAAKTRAQEDVAGRSQFGGRSGGMAAANAAESDKVHSDITDLIGHLTGSSVSGLSGMGQNLLSQGISGSEAGFGEAKQMQQQKASMWNDIIGSSMQVASMGIGAAGGVANSPAGSSQLLAGLQGAGF